MDVGSLLKRIIKKEVHLHFSKSGGHGGQNINKRKTKAELYFNVKDSCFLSPEQKKLIIENSGHRLHHHEHILIFTCQEERYQKANRIKVIEHFKQFMHEILDYKGKKDLSSSSIQIKEEKSRNKRKHLTKKFRRRRHHLNDDN